MGANRWMRGRLLLAGGVVVATLAGCGVSGDKPTTVQAGAFEGAQGANRLSRAAEATGKVDTFRMVTKTTTSFTGSKVDDVHMTSTIEGEFDDARGNAHMRMSFEGLPALGDEDFGGLEAMEFVVLGDTAYVKAAGLGTKAKPWVMAKDEELAGEVDESWLGEDVMSADSFLAMLEEEVGPITTIGHEEIRGVDTTHVRAEIDLDEAMRDVKGKSRKELEEMRERLDVEAMPVDVWVSDDGLVHRMRMSTSMSMDMGKQKTAMEMSQQVDLFGFGEPVDIEAPPASQVREVDFDEMFGGGD